MCHIIEWEDHVGCEHDEEDKVGKFNQTICAKRKYRFLKEPKGVMPSHKGDLFIEYASGSMLGVSLKAGGAKTSDPQDESCRG